MPQIQGSSPHWLMWGHSRKHPSPQPITTSPASPPASSEPTAIAVHDESGRIVVDIVGEDAIDLSSLQKQRRESGAIPKSPSQAPTEDDTPVPVMNVCIMIVGTRGDVQPFIGIAKRLQQDGHRVRLATHAVYRDFVTEHGVEFYPLGGDPKELAAYMVKTGGHLIPVKYETITQDVPRNMQMLEEILNSTWPAVSAPDPDALGKGVPGKPFQAQAIISNPVTYGHIHVAERLGVPLHIMFPQPWVPTVAFPHPLSNMPYNDKPQKRNYMSYKLVDLLMWQGTESMVNQFRTEVLGLRKIRKGDGGRDILLDLAIPHAFMWSPALVPKPADWGNIYDVIGTVLLKEAGSKYTPTPELEKFLGTDGGPIFVGFGSMIIEDPEATTKMIIEAARLANVRVLIQSSWSDMSGSIDVPDNIFFLGNCPHDWLMPRVSAVVHHGGAGTTAAGLLAGKPTFIVPFFGDQPFWGRAVVKAGVGVAPCPITDLTVEKLRSAFEQLQQPEIRQRAETLRAVMDAEDGVAEAVKCFYRHMPLKVMRCEVCTTQLATKWSEKDRIRLCSECEYVISCRQENSPDDIIDYHCVDYSARGPESTLEGVAAGAGALLHELGSGVKDVFIKPAQGYREQGATGAVIGLTKGVFQGLFIRPIQGVAQFADHIGFAKGLGGLVIRPVYGVALLADHIAAGHANCFRPEGSQKRSTVFDNHIQNAIGHEDVSDGYVVPGMSRVEIEERVEVAAKKRTRPQVVVEVADDVKANYIAKFNEVLKLRQAQAAPELVTEFVSINAESSGPVTPPAIGLVAAEEDVPASKVSLLKAEIDESGCISMDFDADDEDDVVPPALIRTVSAFWTARREEKEKARACDHPTVPKMNICLATIGTWHHNIKQYVAIGVRLMQDGHRVRIAAHELFRKEIVARGLEFYPLEGAPVDMHDLFRNLQTSLEQTRMNGPRRFFAVNEDEADIRAVLFSLWPATTSPDPNGLGDGIPGDPFRADLLISHPLLISHVHVAERLGIPLHCISMSPLSPTFAFPHILTSYLRKPGDPVTNEFRESNYLSYSVVNGLLWRQLAHTIEDFRSSIGLSGAWSRPDLLVEWDVPHTYLWEPSVIPRPIDWPPHLAVVGHVTLDDEMEHQRWSSFKASRSLNDFALSTGAPLIYVGFYVDTLDPVELKYLLKRIDRAAQDARVLVLVQVLGDRADGTPFHTDNIYEVAPDVPFALLVRKVAATIHWGGPSMTWEGIAAGKPVCVWPRVSTQHWFGNALASAGCGPSPVDLSSLRAEEITPIFQALVDPKLRKHLEEMRRQFSNAHSLELVIDSVYSNLPIPAMECDLDPTKVAHIYDIVYEMKLSYEAHFAVQDVRGHNGEQNVAYKPLYYSGQKPPKYSLRGIRGERRRAPEPPAIPLGIASISATLAALLHQDSTTSEDERGTLPPDVAIARALKRTMSYVPKVVARPKYWASDDEERRESRRLAAAYDELVNARTAPSSVRESLTSSASTSSSKSS